MEAIVIFSAGLVVFCGYIALVDAVRDWQHGRAQMKHASKEKEPARLARGNVISATLRREGGGGGHWPRPLAGSA